MSVPVVVWVGVFGYLWLIDRKVAALEAALESERS